MRIEYALIADHAEVNGGKLYLMGGGWDTFFAPQEPIPLRLAFAFGVRVDWEETNRPIAVSVVLEDDDGQRLANMEGTLQVGRPPGLVPGTGQLVQTAGNFTVSAPAFGGYRVRISAGAAEGSPETTIPFRIVRRPA